MVTKGTGIELREREGLVLKGRRKGAAFQVSEFHRAPIERKSLAVHTQLGPAAVGLSGRDLILKYTRVPAVPDWQLGKLMEFEVQEIASQAGGGLASDYNLLPIPDEMTGEDTVLLALAKNDALDAAAEVLQAAKGSVEAFTPNSIAIYNAFLMAGPVTDEHTVLIAWVGESSIDLALVQGQSLLFARNVSGGLSVLDGAISQTFNVRQERARKIRTEVLNLDPAARGNYSSSQEEKVAHSVAAVAGQLQAALRSTLAFCQSQTNIQDLRLDRVLLCGPGAKIKGMDRYLAAGLGTRVEVWDPSNDIDTSLLADPSELLDAGPELPVALGLAMAPCFDDLYSIEILPEAVKRRRRFTQRTVFNIAAGVIAALYLLWHAYQSQGLSDELVTAKSRISGTLRRIENTNKAAEKLIESNAEKAEELRQLTEIAVPLHGLQRTYRALRRHLPSDLWITKIQTDRKEPTWQPEKKVAAGRLHSRRSQIPVIIYDGKGVAVSGHDIQATYQGFVTTMKADSDVPHLVPQADETGKFTFKGLVDYLYPVADPETTKAGGN